MVRIILRDQELAKLHPQGEKLAHALTTEIAAQNLPIKLKGPMPSAINRIAGYHRSQILLFSPTAPPLQRLLASIRKQKTLLTSDRGAGDVDPGSLLYRTASLVRSARARIECFDSES